MSKLYRVKRILLTIVCVLCLTTVVLSAGNVGVNLRPGYVIPTHGFYNGWNPQKKVIRSTVTTDFQYTFSLSESRVYQGGGVGIHSFFADDMMGSPVSFYILQGAPLLQICKGLTFGYEWNFGLSTGWKDNASVIVSPINAYINVAVLFDWKINRYWSLIFGPEYTHFSNGDTMFPNGGANTINFRVGTRCDVSGNKEDGVEKIFEFDGEERQFADNLTYDITAFGAWRADRYMDNDGRLVIDNNAYAVAGMHFNPLYHLNDYLLAGASIDMMYDASANRHFKQSAIKHCAAGVSVRGEISMPIFSVNVGAGYNLLHYGPDLKGFYGLFSLKAFLTGNLFLNVGYRLGQTNYAHNMMFGLGWRFRKPL